MAEIRQTIRAEFKFTAGQNSSWTQSFNNLKMSKPDHWTVEKALYDGTDGIAGPISVSSSQFGQDFTCFQSTNSQVAAGNITSTFTAPSGPSSRITNTSDQYINGTCDFTCQQGGQTINTLNGTLMIIFNIVKKATRKEERKG